jgi:hypothetical protein
MLCLLFSLVPLLRYCCGNPNTSADKPESSKPAAAAGAKSAPWFKFDDEIVTRVSLKEVLDAEAYILM